MNLLDTLRAAWQGVTANLMRSVLTTLGILIGVAAVIVLVAVGNGSAKAVADQIESLGTNTLTVTAGRGSSTFTLTTDLARQLTDKTLAPDVASVSPTTTTSGTGAADQKSTTIQQVIGTYPSYFKATNSPVSSGTYFTNDDVLSNAKVVVLGKATAEDLFRTADAAVGKTVMIGATNFTVVGILKDQGSEGPGSSGSIAVAPLSTIQASLAGYGALSSIIVEASSSDTVDAAQAQIETVLNNAGHVTDTTNLPYNVQNASALLETQEESGRTFTILLGVVAGISLLVGGLGITNIMLVTVTERTREIGVRKALGAPRRSILGQFLVESSLLSLAGGILGVVVGLIVSQVTIIGIEPVVVPASVAGALVVCLLIGVFFGSFPANRAAGLRPVEALRHE
ncbi:ABC transporter permease [Aeromicrobium panaciterrae]|uniref:ABC transporter permease n=1 Tax=Aeromicrobium panaciterrae TaxID=363861 RepID=UPI0031D1BF2A